MKKKILIAFGTRPEAIKMVPLIDEFRRYTERFHIIVCVTGQHREMLDQVLSLFNIIPDYDLKVMKPGQSLFEITSGVLMGMREVLQKEQPDLVFVHGDTTTSTAVALSAFYYQIPVAHIEAGLRTFNIYSPWPEEMNRQITSRIARYHFAPTDSARENLIKENIPADKIIVTGNTVIDALRMVIKRIQDSEELRKSIVDDIFNSGYDTSRLSKSRKLILITGHRRENLGIGFQNICEAIKHLSEKFRDFDFLYPVHYNPVVRSAVNSILGTSGSDNVFLTDPLEYLPFVYLMQRSYLILTDSGGIQEEAPDFGIPVLVMRDTTERPEGLEAGTILLVGTEKEKIIESVSMLIEGADYYRNMTNKINPFGDGKASNRIIAYFLNELNISVK